MDLTYRTFAEQLRMSIPGFEPVYAEHLADNDEVLPHVLLGDLVRFLESEVSLRGSESDALKAAMPLLERAMGSSEALLRELIAVSFIENLEPEAPAFAEIKDRFGPHLSDQYRKHQAFLSVTK